MTLITKEPFARVYNCKLVDFTHGVQEHEHEVQIVMCDGAIEYEELTNIAYIKV